MNITRRTTITINNDLHIAHDDEEKTFRVITPLGKDWHEADVIRLVQRYRDQALREAKALAEFLKVAAEKWPAAVEPAKNVEAERFAIAMQVLKEEAERPVDKEEKK